MGLFSFFSRKKSSNLKVLHFYMPSIVAEDEFERLSKDPPSVPVENIHIEQNEDISKKYNITCWPTLVLIDKKGNALKEFRGQVGGSQIDEYIKFHNL
jgi:thioredoxin-related protein